LLPLQYEQDFERLLAEDRYQFRELLMLAVNSSNRSAVIMLQIIKKHKLDVCDAGAPPRWQVDMGKLQHASHMAVRLRRKLWLVFEARFNTQSRGSHACATCAAVAVDYSALRQIAFVKSLLSCAGVLATDTVCRE
jgi:hypothetical protein